VLALNRALEDGFVRLYWGRDEGLLPRHLHCFLVIPPGFPLSPRLSRYPRCFYALVSLFMLSLLSFRCHRVFLILQAPFPLLSLVRRGAGAGSLLQLSSLSHRLVSICFDVSPRVALDPWFSIRQIRCFVYLSWLRLRPCLRRCTPFLPRFLRLLLPSLGALLSSPCPARCCLRAVFACWEFCRCFYPLSGTSALRCHLDGIGILALDCAVAFVTAYCPRAFVVAFAPLSIGFRLAAALVRRLRLRLRRALFSR
jgi:hypothetical protein